MKELLLDSIRHRRPLAGPGTVHVDVTNGCNAACVSCWDHSPLLTVPRPREWKRHRLPLQVFRGIVKDLARLSTTRALILSGMGDPLTHPDLPAMAALVKAHGWALTLITNLVADSAPALADGPPIDNLLVGVHGVSPETYAAFHPGWDESHFFRLVRHLRLVTAAGSTVRHVHVVTRHNAHELPEMVRFGARLGAERVNLKLASLGGGTEAAEITAEQRAWLLAEGIPAARAVAAETGQATTLDLFETQLRAGPGATTDMRSVGCYMGYAYARVTAEGLLLFCCNPEAYVGNLGEGPLVAQWQGEQWQALRARLDAGRYLPGCEHCGKFEQNVKIARALGRIP